MICKLMTRPILYSFRRCPYAMRARMAIAYAGIAVELREVVLRDKPPSLLTYSPKGEVPVLLLPDATVIDESRDIMLWALGQQDTEGWLPAEEKERAAMDSLMDENDSEFKAHLDHYKYAYRFPAHTAEHYRALGEVFLAKLEARLSATAYLFADSCRMADVAIFPFVRQFAFVDKGWFDGAPYPGLQQWLEGFLASALFARIMPKYPQWHEGDAVTVFPEIG
jgi:glutathione S-transferase